MIGWQAIVASGGYLCSSLIKGLVIMNHSTFKMKPWQSTLIYWASIFFAILVNTVISHLLPKIESFILILHILGFFAILVPLVYYAPHGNASDVFTLFLNRGHWQTQGLSFMVGVLGPTFSFLGRYSTFTHSLIILNMRLMLILGADSAVHVCFQTPSTWSKLTTH